MDSFQYKFYTQVVLDAEDKHIPLTDIHSFIQDGIQDFNDDTKELFLEWYKNEIDTIIKKEKKYNES